MRHLAMLSLLLVTAFHPGGAAAEEIAPSRPPSIAGGGAGVERFTYGNGERSADVTRYLLFGDMEIPRVSLLGDDRLTLRLGLHSYTLDNRSATGPALMAGISWRGNLAPPLPEGVEGRPFAPRWGIEGRLSAQLLDAPEGPAGAAFDMAGEVLFRRRVSWFSSPAEVYLGPSLRYGFLQMDRVYTADNGALRKRTDSLYTESLWEMAGFVAGMEIRVGKRFILRPEARAGADLSACVSLAYLPTVDLPTKPSQAAPEGGTAVGTEGGGTTPFQDGGPAPLPSPSPSPDSRPEEGGTAPSTPPSSDRKP